MPLPLLARSFLSALVVLAALPVPSRAHGPCAADQAGFTGCGSSTVSLWMCNGTYWNIVQDCTATGAVCIATSNTLASCVPSTTTITTTTITTSTAAAPVLSSSTNTVAAISAEVSTTSAAVSTVISSAVVGTACAVPDDRVCTTDQTLLQCTTGL
ncbi:hypothetical protein HDU84_004511, partial [Entophlyctis sp. JEL0112]